MHGRIATKGRGARHWTLGCVVAACAFLAVRAVDCPDPGDHETDTGGCVENVCNCHNGEDAVGADCATHGAEGVCAWPCDESYFFLASEPQEGNAGGRQHWGARATHALATVRHPHSLARSAVASRLPRPRSGPASPATRSTCASAPCAPRRMTRAASRARRGTAAPTASAWPRGTTPSTVAPASPKTCASARTGRTPEALPAPSTAQRPVRGRATRATTLRPGLGAATPARRATPSRIARTSCAPERGRPSARSATPALAARSAASRSASASRGRSTPRGPRASATTASPETIERSPPSATRSPWRRPQR